MEKATIRKQIRDIKRSISPEEKLRRSKIITTRLEREARFSSSRVILLYWSMADEVQTHDLVERIYTDKIVLLPCVDGNSLRLRQYTGPKCMVAGEQFGIGEPTGEEWTNLDGIDLIVVPGVAFDKQCNRMGRGRGFYDRMLQSTPGAYKIGLAYDFQLFDTIPVEQHDIPMNAIITDLPEESCYEYRLVSDKTNACEQVFAPSQGQSLIN